MKKNYILQGATLFKDCSEKTFKIIRLTTILLMVTVLNVFKGNAVPDYTSLKLDYATDPVAIVQKNIVTGTVTDEKGNPLPGVSVIVTGSTV
jgi:protocatechuate 3,4-dioxygenase beta subunit